MTAAAWAAKGALAKNPAATPAANKALKTLPPARLRFLSARGFPHSFSRGSTETDEAWGRGPETGKKPAAFFKQNLLGNKKSTPGYPKTTSALFLHRRERPCKRKTCFRLEAPKNREIKRNVRTLKQRNLAGVSQRLPARRPKRRELARKARKQRVSATKRANETMASAPSLLCPA